MRISDLRYSLKPENIACEPPEVRLGRRDLGRLMVVDRNRQAIQHSSMPSFPDWLAPGDVLILNNSKRIPGVLKARTVGEGAQVELRFAGLESAEVGLCRLYPTHFIREDVQLRLANGVTLRVIEHDIEPHKLCRVKSQAGRLKDALKSVGLPITSFFSQGYWKLENYNNFYATEEGSIESPMAGMHFTPELLDAVKDRGIQIGFITLHSVGSWLPFLEDEIKDHKMLKERYSLPLETARMIAEARTRNNRIVACGSTVMRTLETAARDDGSVASGAGETDLFICPGYKFRIADAYFTNFHISQSSLMVLDASFCPIDLLMKSYREAQSDGYLFHEFGDAILYV